MDYSEKNENYAQNREKKMKLNQINQWKNAIQINKQTNRMCNIEVAFHGLILHLCSVGVLLDERLSSAMDRK